MKNLSERNKRLLTVLMACAAGLAIIASSCTEQTQTGSLSISFATKRSVSTGIADFANKSIAPNFEAEVDLIKLSLTIADGSITRETTVDSTTATATLSDIEAGAWTITADAYDSSYSTVTPIGSGSTTLTINTGSSNSALITISFPAGSETVDFSIPLSWPASSGVNNVAMTLDSAGTATDLVVDTSGDPYTTTISSSLLAGKHKLSLSFSRVADGLTTPAGTFVESLNIYSGSSNYVWIDNSGSQNSTWTFEESDFLSSNALLGDFTLLLDGSDMDYYDSSYGFASQTTDYGPIYITDSSVTAGTSYISFIPSKSAAGQYISYKLYTADTVDSLPATAPTTSLASGTSSGDLTIQNANRLEVNVQAPDKSNTKTYTFTLVLRGNATITFDISPEYQGLEFSALSTTVAAGNTLDLSTGNSTLDTSGSSWTWYMDGTEISGQTTSSLSWVSTESDVGDHIISCSVTYNGVTYSGSILLTVLQ